MRTHKLFHESSSMMMLMMMMESPKQTVIHSEIIQTNLRMFGKCKFRYARIRYRYYICSSVGLWDAVWHFHWFFVWDRNVDDDVASMFYVRPLLKISIVCTYLCSFGNHAAGLRNGNRRIFLAHIKTQIHCGKNHIGVSLKLNLNTETR
jgi:hypothetical protein